MINRTEKGILVISFVDTVHRLIYYRLSCTAGIFSVFYAGTGFYSKLKLALEILKRLRWQDIL